MNVQKMYSILLPNDPRLPILMFDYSKPGNPKRVVTLPQVKDAVFAAVLQGHTVTLDELETPVVGAVLNIFSRQELARLNERYKLTRIEDGVTP